MCPDMFLTLHKRFKVKKTIGTNKWFGGAVRHHVALQTPLGAERLPTDGTLIRPGAVVGRQVTF